VHFTFNPFPYKLQWQSITHAHQYPEIIVCAADNLKQLTLFGEPEDVDSDANVKRPYLTTRSLKKVSRSK
jgi:hypothetical protein